jgi:hypothetical protein
VSGGVEERKKSSAAREEVPLIAGIEWDRSGVAHRATGGLRRQGWAEMAVALWVARGPCLGWLTCGARGQLKPTCPHCSPWVGPIPIFKRFPFNQTIPDL